LDCIAWNQPGCWRALQSVMSSSRASVALSAWLTVSSKYMSSVRQYWLYLDGAVQSLEDCLGGAGVVALVFVVEGDSASGEGGASELLLGGSSCSNAPLAPLSCGGQTRAGGRVTGVAKSDSESKN
jgi:hypothetical protein